MRIYKAFPAYSTYLDIYHRRDPSLRLKSFDHQLNALKNDFFPWVLSWSQFNEDKSVEVFETIHNDYYLQQAWADYRWKEDDDWRKRIVLAQIKDFRPDVCVIYPPELFTPGFVEEIRDLLDYPVLIGGYDGMDRKNIDLYRGYDFVITCSRFISEFYSNCGVSTYPLEFGFDSRVLASLTPSRHRYEVGFSGSIFPRVHDDRLELIRYLIGRRTNLTVSSEFEYEKHFALVSRKMLRSVKKGTFHEFFDHYRIHQRNVGPLYGREMFQFLHDSDTVLNLHGDKIDFAANVRLFEATGVGSCLLTDWKKNIGEIYEPDKEIVTFRSKEEAYDKLVFLHKHESVRRDIAERAQKRTLAEYSYSNRIPGVIAYVKQLYG